MNAGWVNKSMGQVTTLLLKVKECNTEAWADAVSKVVRKQIIPREMRGYKWTPDGGMFRSAGKEDDFSISM